MVSNTRESQNSARTRWRFTGENKVINNFILDNASGQAENLSSTSNIDKSQNISDDDSDEGTLFKNTAQMNQKNY